MTTRRGRTQKCAAAQARQRLAQARSYLDVASLAADENDPTLEYAGVAASVAITPGGKRAAGQLRQLIDIKDTAHYGLISVTASQLERALRQAQHLVDFAERQQLST